MAARASDRCISGQVDGGPGSGAATMPQGWTRADDDADPVGEGVGGDEHRGGQVDGRERAHELGVGLGRRTGSTVATPEISSAVRGLREPGDIGPGGGRLGERHEQTAEGLALLVGGAAARRPPWRSRPGRRSTPASADARHRIRPAAAPTRYFSSARPIGLGSSAVAPHEPCDHTDVGWRGRQARWSRALRTDESAMPPTISAASTSPLGDGPARLGQQLLGPGAAVGGLHLRPGGMPRRSATIAPPSSSLKTDRGEDNTSPTWRSGSAPASATARRTASSIRSTGWASRSGSLLATWAAPTMTGRTCPPTCSPMAGTMARPGPSPQSAGGDRGRSVHHGAMAATTQYVGEGSSWAGSPAVASTRGSACTGLPGVFDPVSRRRRPASRSLLGRPRGRR